MSDGAGSVLGYALAEERRNGHVTAGGVEAAFRLILRSAEADEREGTMRTPERAAKAWRELTAGYDVDVAALVTTFDAEGHDEMVVVKSIPFHSLCEHHLLPFSGKAHVGYIPNGSIVGLSKIARIVDAYARRLQVQERLTDQIADVLAGDPVHARGVIVVVEAEHLCMSMRGVQRPGAVTSTSVVRGILKDDQRARAEAFALIRG